MDSRRYMHYLVKGGPAPRSTLHSRRKKTMQKRRQIKPQHQQQSQEQQQDVEQCSQLLVHTDELLQVEEETTQTEGFHKRRLSSTESDTDAEVGRHAGRKDQKRKRRKLRAKPLKEAIQFSSSGEENQENPSVCSVTASSPDFVQPKLHSPNEDVMGECLITHDEDEHELPRLNNDDKSADSPLCPCTDSTVGDIVFMTLVLGLRHGLTWVAQVDILKMIKVIFKNAIIPCTKPQYLKKIEANKHDRDITYHVFCDECDSYLGEKKEDKLKRCKICDKDKRTSSPSNKFVSLSIQSQLQTFLKDQKFVNLVINHRFNRTRSPDKISDVYDGNVYKQLSADGGILSSPLNMSYTFFTDGVAFGKYSNKTIWPIYLTINELPYEERSNYFILAAVYAGSKDPNQIYFLKPFVEQANILARDGISWIYNGQKVNSRVIPLCCVADSVARFQILNFQTFHAEYGCTFCYKQAEWVRGGSRYTISEPVELRSEESLRQDLIEVYNRRNETQDKDRVFRGVKGTCNLMSLNFFSVTSSLTVDFMHCLLLGNVKAHTGLVLESTRKKMWEGMNDRIGMDHLIDVIDKRIMAIQSNSSIIRELRPLKDRALWRANEWKIWILFYFLPCLKGLLKNKYLMHFGMLSKATFILLQSSVTYQQVQEAHRLLMLYTYFYQRYFGEENMVYNIHLLSHLGKGILDFGPMWGHSSFPFEAQNRHLLQLCKSPFSVAFQIARKFFVFKSLPLLCSKLVHTQSAISLCEKILDYKKLVRYERANDGNCVLLGKGTCCSLLESDSAIVSDFIQPCNYFDCVSYQRMILNRKKYSTESYSQGKDNNDSCAFLHNGGCALIQKIVKLPTAKVVLLVQDIQVEQQSYCSNEHFELNHIRYVREFGEMKCVQLENIAEPCLLMKAPKGFYVSNVPYGCSVE